MTSAWEIIENIVNVEKVERVERAERVEKVEIVENRENREVTASRLPHLFCRAENIVLEFHVTNNCRRQWGGSGNDSDWFLGIP